MSANDPLKPALEHYRQKRAALLDEVRKIDLTIRQLENDLGEAPGDDRPSGVTDPYTFSGEMPSPDRSAPASGKLPSVRHDEFFGMTQGEAAKAYLTKVGHAVSMDQLVEALTAGGCRVGGVSAKRTLYISLVRNIREFVPVAKNIIGLRAFYPGLKSSATKSAATKSAASKSKKAKGKRKAKKLLDKKKAGMAKTAPPVESPAHKLVYKTLGDGELHARADILKAGKEAGVMPIAILGLLRNAKDIETLGDQFRLRKGDQEEEKKMTNAS